MLQYLVLLKQKNYLYIATGMNGVYMERFL